MKTTKPDNFRQGVVPDVIEVRPEQDQALVALLTGATDQQAADAAGVSRQTVSTWLHQDDKFVAELNRRRALLWASHQDQLRGMVGAALQVLKDDLASDDPVVRRDAMKTVVKALGLSAADLVPTGETDPEKIRLKWTRDQVSSLDWTLASNY